ncbi:MAG TPA: 30S ribosomal protein S15 [Deltaproteobacteria bacterium]|nr:MAG: 30S ribosomal protein S15 [Deltaproteobacteria bacterium GWA2_45_12]HBF12849.1 30S ribosomal protein S15 [Deltaproteobacteria bacterium]
MLFGEQKQEIISKFRVHEKDTGSSEVQIAILSKKIEELTKHFDTHKKDFSSRRGLLQMVGRRRKLLDYIKDTNTARYSKLIGELGIRK